MKQRVFRIRWKEAAIHGHRDTFETTEEHIIYCEWFTK